MATVHVLQYIRRGWSANSSIGKELSPNTSQRAEVSVQHGFLPWGSQVVVHPLEHKDFLAELHEAHSGMACMKSLGRMHMIVWWPGIDADIERSFQLCQHCQVNQSSPPVAPLHPWQWTSRPWTKLHIDYAGPLCDKMILVIVDTHSK